MPYDPDYSYDQAHRRTPPKTIMDGRGFTETVTRSVIHEEIPAAAIPGTVDPDGLDIKRTRRAGFKLRDKYREHLHAMASEGYLPEEELTKRLEVASEADTEERLKPLVADLPPFPITKEQIKASGEATASTPKVWLKRKAAEIIFLQLFLAMVGILTIVLPWVAKADPISALITTAAGALMIVSDIIWSVTVWD